jgi:hypothetical protein
MAQNFGMIANYGEHKEKAKSNSEMKLPEGRPAEPEIKKPRVEAPGEDKTTRKEEKATGA